MLLVCFFGGKLFFVFVSVCVLIKGIGTVAPFYVAFLSLFLQTIPKLAIIIITINVDIGAERNLGRGPGVSLKATALKPPMIERCQRWLCILPPSLHTIHNVREDDTDTVGKKKGRRIKATARKDDLRCVNASTHKVRDTTALLSCRECVRFSL